MSVIQSFILGEEHRLGVFDISAVKKIVRPEREELALHYWGCYKYDTSGKLCVLMDR